MIRLNQGCFLVRKKKQGTKFRVPDRRDNFPTTPVPAACPEPTRVIFSRERRIREKNLESLDVGTTSPYLPSLLRDQTQPGLFSREKEEAGNKTWSPMCSGHFPNPFPPYCVTKLNQGYSLVRLKKQGTKFGVPGRWDKFPNPPLPTA